MKRNFGIRTSRAILLSSRESILPQSVIIRNEGVLIHQSCIYPTGYGIEEREMEP